VSPALQGALVPLAFFGTGLLLGLVWLVCVIWDHRPIR